MSGSRTVNFGASKTGFESLAKTLVVNPMDQVRADYMGVDAAKKQSDMAAALDERTRVENLRTVLANPNATALDIARATAITPAWAGNAGNLGLVFTMNNPNATQAQKDAAYTGAGHPFSGTETGFRFGEAQQTARTLGAARISAGPGYAKVAEDKRQFEYKPVAITNPADNTTHYVYQRDLPSQQGDVQPFDPSRATALTTPEKVQLVPGGPTMLMPRGSVPSTAYAPPPDSLVTQQAQPQMSIDLTQPDAPAAYRPKGQITEAPGRYADPPPVKPQSDFKLDYSATRDITDLAKTMLARRAGQPDNYYIDTKEKPGAPLPPDFAKLLDQITVRAGDLTKFHNDMGRGVTEAMNEILGGEDWSVNVPGWWSRQVGGEPTVKKGTAGYQAPQVTTDTAGARVVVPPQATKGGYTPPTISTRGNPNPAPTAPTAPTPAPTPRPQMSDADIIAHARASIQANPAAKADIIKRLQGWNIDAAGL